jgi:hypothetical protein
VLEVLADLTWHLRDDTYRFPAPKDPTGHDLYRLSLHRLENWDKRFPGRLRDVTSFARAEALERLGGYAAARDLYAKVAAMPSPLAEKAAEGEKRARVRERGRAAGRLRPRRHADALRAAGRLGRAHTRRAGTTFEPIVQVEEGCSSG